MSRQSNYARNQFFNKSIQRAQILQKKRKDIRDIKNGNIVEPDPVEIVETIDETVADPEEVIDE